MPVFRTRKEAFEWLKKGEKTIDIRKGKPQRGDIAVYISGRKVLRLRIIRKETGMINEVVRSDNYRLVVPSASTVENATSYLLVTYNLYGDIITAYYVAPKSDI